MTSRKATSLKAGKAAKSATKKAGARRAASKTTAAKKAPSTKATRKSATSAKPARPESATPSRAPAAKPKATAKKATTKKTVSKKTSAKKTTTKKAMRTKSAAAPARAAVAKPVGKPVNRKKAERTKVATPSRATKQVAKAPTASDTAPEKKAELDASAVRAKGRKAIVRKAGTPPKGVNGTTGNGAMDAPRPAVRRRPKGEGPAVKGPVLEVNPKLESTRGRLPKAEGQTGGAKPMTFAERQRAEAEARFQQIAPKWKEEPPPPPPSNGAQPSFHKSEFEIRVSERDSLTTALRMEQNKRRSLAIAQKLADDFQLPPDQGVLMKVITLKDERLTLLALEELLELEDRGRVRPSDDLVKVLKKARGKNPEIAELRGLLLQKLGVKKS